MDDSEEPKSSFKVVDHRRFDTDGNDREFAESTPESESDPAANSPAFFTPREKPQATEEGIVMSSEKSTLQKDPVDILAPGGEEKISFSSFVISLATQALMQLGEIPAPEGMELPSDPVAAKQTIDIISMLEEKTRGNLDASEQQLVTEMLHNLRMCYVRKS